MKSCALIASLLLLACLSSCGQDEPRHTNAPGKIPLSAPRWYQLTNATEGLTELFDGQLHQKPNTGYNKLLPHYEAWYPLYEGEQMAIDSIMFYCWRCLDASHPVTLFAVDTHWKRTAIATFAGARAATWEGPDPMRPDVFALPKRISGFRYLILDCWGEFPAEMELYGTYTPPNPLPAPTHTQAPLSNYFGINTYEWDAENPAHPNAPDTSRMAAFSHFSGVRHYLDWEKLEPTDGHYTFNPSHSGSWNYDTLYQWWQQQNITVLTCLKTIPKWLQQTYPEGRRNTENVPAPFGSNLSEPAAYLKQAQLVYQFAARYGNSKSLAINSIKVDTILRWTGDDANRVRTGLGIVHYIECDNERDKWWKGRDAYQNGREYAANLSAFYDGHHQQLGPNAGVKNADPTMKVVMGGLASADTGYLMGMIDWCKQYRGYTAGGRIDLPWDVINYHYYCNNSNGTDHEPTTGVAPEATTTYAIAQAFVAMAQRFAPHMPVWVTETGYDINQQSTQRAIPIGSKTALQTQADWALRTALLLSRAGIERSFVYQLYDDNATSTIKYGTSGMVNANRQPRPAAQYFGQVRQRFGSCTFDSTIANYPMVDRYHCGTTPIYVLWMPTQNDSKTDFTLQLPKSVAMHIWQPSAGSNENRPKVEMPKLGRLTVTVSETPVFVTPATP